jgi:hypothetical protein
MINGNGFAVMADESGLRSGGLRSRLSGRLPDGAPTDPCEHDRVSRRGAEAQSFLRQPKQEYHKRTVTEESAQVHNLLALRPSASARWSSAVDVFGFAVIIDGNG